MNFKNLEEDTIYEVLVSTRNEDNTLNIKAFGMQIRDDNIVLNLYPNHTLFNIKKSGFFDVHFTSDILLYTRATLGIFDDFQDFDVSVTCCVIGYSTSNVEDVYGENITTTITAKPINIIKNNETLPIINRSTNKIMELLVDYTRNEYMDVHEKNIFIEKLEKTEKFINKNGNEKHKKSIKLIKNKMRINPH